MKTYRIMTDNQKAFHRDGELSEIIKGMGDFAMMTAVRVDIDVVESCITCASFRQDTCSLTGEPMHHSDHCQRWKND